MPVTIKAGQMGYKSPSSGEYVGINGVAERTTAEQVADVEAAGTAAVALVQTKADEVTAQLANAAEVRNMIAGVFDPAVPYVAGQYVIQTVTVSGNSVNKLFRFKVDHPAGAWIGTDAEEIKLSDEVGRVDNLLSSILSQTKNLLDDTKRFRSGGSNIYFGVTDDSDFFGTYLKAGTYTFTVWFDDPDIKANGLYIDNSSGQVARAYTNNSVTFTLSIDSYLSIRVYSSSYINNITNAQIEKGSISTEYVFPFTPNDIVARRELIEKINNNQIITLDKDGYRDTNGLYTSSAGYSSSYYVKVNGGKLKAVHHVIKSSAGAVPWCVFLTNNGVIFYITDTANEIPEEDINLQNVVSEIDIPSDAVAMSVCSNKTTNYSFEIIYDILESYEPIVFDDITLNGNSSFLIEEGIPCDSTGNYYMSDYVQVKSGDILETYLQPAIATNYNNYRGVLAVLYDKDFFPINTVKIGDEITSVSGNLSRLHVVEKKEKYVRVSSITNSGWACITRIGSNETDNDRSCKEVIEITSSMLTVDRYYDRLGCEKQGMLSSNFIDIYEGDLVTCRSFALADASSENYNCIVSFFDSKKAFISGVYNTGSSASLINVKNVVAPTGARYVMFTKHATSYNFYAIITRLSTPVRSEIEPPANNKISLTYPNRYKSISILGDSITQGEGVTNNIDDSYAGILRKMFSVENGKKLNYGFCSFSTMSNDMVRFVRQSGFTRDYGDSSALGGDSYSSSTANSTLEFFVSKQFPLMKIASVFGESGVFTVSQNETIFATIDLSEKTGIDYSDAFSVENADFSSNFVITVISGSVKVSGVQLIENEDWITFNNYGRSGAGPTLFVGDLFDKETESDIVFYALGANSGAVQLNEALTSIKQSFKNNTARKIVLDVINDTAVNKRKHSLLRSFASETGADYIGTLEYLFSVVPELPNDFYADGVHPAVNGHKFIAENAAKCVGLSITSKDIANMLLSD